MQSMRCERGRLAAAERLPRLTMFLAREPLIDLAGEARWCREERLTQAPRSAPQKDESGDSRMIDQANLARPTATADDSDVRKRAIDAYSERATAYAGAGRRADRHTRRSAAARARRRDCRGRADRRSAARARMPKPRRSAQRRAG